MKSSKSTMFTFDIKPKYTGYTGGAPTKRETGNKTPVSILISSSKPSPPPHPEIDYSEVCARRYERARRRYQAQFQCEIRAMVALQPSAMEAVRLERAFQRVCVWPEPPPPRPNPTQERRLAALLEQPRVKWPP